MPLPSRTAFPQSTQDYSGVRVKTFRTNDQGVPDRPIADFINEAQKAMGRGTEQAFVAVEVAVVQPTALKPGMLTVIVTKLDDPPAGF